MSKASQRRLADLQKRVEKLKKKSPHMKALVELEEMDPEDVFSNPVRYWSRLLNALQADEPHEQHALLESAFELHSAFFECLHDAVLFEQADMFLFTEPPMLPGFVLGIDGDGMGAGFTAQSPLFTPAAPEGIPWATHYADLQSRTGQSSVGVEGWFWILSSFETGLPLFVLGVSKGGAARLWVRVREKWIKSQSSEFIAPLLAAFGATRLHPHEVAKGALAHALEAGTIARGSSTSEIPGTPNAVSTLVTEYAQPYVALVSTLVDLLCNQQRGDAEDRDRATEEKTRQRHDLKTELANVQKLLAAERLVSAGLKKELQVKASVVAKPAQPSAQGSLPEAPPLRTRLGVFFGQ